MNDFLAKVIVLSSWDYPWALEPELSELLQTLTEEMKMKPSETELLLGKAIQFLKDIDEMLVNDIIRLNDYELDDADLELIDDFQSFYQSHDEIRRNYLRRDDNA